MAQSTFPVSLALQASACSVLGRSENSSGVPADIVASTNGTFLGRRSDALSFVNPRLNELQYRGAWAYHNAAQTVSSGTWTAAQLNSEYHDTDTYHDLVTNNSRLTAPTTGRYFVCGMYAIQTSVGTTWFRIALRANGSAYTWQNDGYPNGGISVVSVSGIFALSAGDYIELAIYHVTGGIASITQPQLAMFPLGIV